MIKASEWILANKGKYNIRVANFSLHSANISRFYLDPLERRVKKLWFNGVVVVAAVGQLRHAQRRRVAFRTPRATTRS